jgi:hypothetical protein
MPAARPLLAALLAALLCLPTAALAGKTERPLPEIEKTGITAFDSVFLKVRDIHQTLATEEARLKKASDDILVALALAEGTPIEDAVADLKQQAKGAVKLEMVGGKPKLSLAGPEVPTQARKGVDAVNNAVKAVGIATTNLARLPAQVQELVAACQGLPAQLNPQLLQEAGLNVMQLPKVAKTLATNVKATVATPARIERTVSSGADLVKSIQSGFAKEGGATVKKGKGGVSLAPLDVPLAYAWADFQDAEVEAAARKLTDLDAILVEETGVVPQSHLVEKHQLQALVALVQGDEDAARQHVQASVVIDPKDDPGDDYGQQIAQWHEEMAKAAKKTEIKVTWSGSRAAFLDGNLLKPGKAAKVLPGDHLVQIEGEGDDPWVTVRMPLTTTTTTTLNLDTVQASAVP